MHRHRLSRTFFACMVALSTMWSCLPVSVFAKAPVPAKAIAPVQKTATQKLFMWKITGDKGTVYLLGSIHLLRPDFYPLPSRIESAFKSSQVLIEELDESKQDAQSIQRLTLQRGIYTGGDRLENHITSKTAEELNKYLARTRKPAGAFSVMKPWFVSINIMINELQQRGFNPALGIDKHFMNKARSAGKPTDQMETADFQLQLLSGFSESLQDKLLLSALVDAENVERDAAQMVRAWKTGNEKEMEELITRDERLYPELKPVMDRLIYDRNVDMADKIVGYMSEPRTHFVVVGAGHLVGARGILQLLRDKKFKVEQMLENTP